MKQCNHCKEFKSEEDFARRYKSVGIRQRTCKVCIAKFNADAYANRSRAHIEKVKDQRSARRDEARKYLYEHLSTHPCIDCGETDPLLLEFDHVRGKKKAAVSQMVGQGFSLESIAKEIAKCEVRCVACHRKKTYKDRGWSSR